MPAIEMTIGEPDPWQRAQAAYLAALEAVNGSAAACRAIRACCNLARAEIMLLEAPAPDMAGLVLKLEVAAADGHHPTGATMKRIVADAHRLIGRTPPENGRYGQGWIELPNSDRTALIRSFGHSHFQ
jgi:hypothetical protein